MYATERDGATRWPAETWCEGFMHGLEFSFQAWKPLFNDPDNCWLLEPMALLGTPEGDEELEAAEDPDAKIEKFTELLGPCVLAIRDYWREHRSIAARPVRIRASRVGRNDPCPCGSNRRFKKRCASPASA